MTMTAPTEKLVEDVASAYFGALGTSTRRGVEIDDAGERAAATQCILQARLSAVLHRLNPVLQHDTIEEVVRFVSHPPHHTLIQNNRWFHTMLTDGVEVEYTDAVSGEMRGGRARLVDFENPGANDLLLVRQLTVTGPSGKRIPPGPDSLPERTADCSDRTQGPGRCRHGPRRCHCATRPLQGRCARPVCS